MPTIFSHAVFASALGSTLQGVERAPKFWILTALCAVIPDADVIAFWFGIDYESVLGHRGITHSLMFAVVLGWIVAALFFAKSGVAVWKLALYFVAVTFSHPVLDMLTDGGLGVALFAPFSNERYFFPWRPVSVSPIGRRFFTERGLMVIMSELIWIWLPSLAIVMVSRLFRGRTRT